MTEVRKILRDYNRLKADVRSLKLDIEEIEEEIIARGASQDNDRVKTSSLSDTTASKAIAIADKTKYYTEIKKKLERKIQRIDNSMRVLTSREKDVIRMRYFEDKSWATIQLALNDCTYGNAKRIELEALKKLEPYLIGKM
jgi:DNA-directed RNA polymerase specialized sigma subunit